MSDVAAGLARSSETVVRLDTGDIADVRVTWTSGDLTRTDEGYVLAQVRLTLRTASHTVQLQGSVAELRDLVACFAAKLDDDGIARGVHQPAAVLEMLGRCT